MKYKKSLVALTLFGCAVQARAYDGTVTFNGQIIDGGTCTVSVDGGGASNTVTLPNVMAINLTAGKNAGVTPFTIALTGCTYSGTRVKADFYSNNIDSATGNMKNTAVGSAATSVQLQLLNAADDTPIRVGTGTTGASGSALVTWTGASGVGSASLKYKVRYLAVSAAAVSGAVQSIAMYTLTYS